MWGADLHEVRIRNRLLNVIVLNSRLIVIVITHGHVHLVVYESLRLVRCGWHDLGDAVGLATSMALRSQVSRETSHGGVWLRAITRLSTLSYRMLRGIKLAGDHRILS